MGFKSLGETKSVEIVFCVDCTSGMAAGFHSIKEKLIQIQKNMRESVRRDCYRARLNKYRVQIIAFGNYVQHGPNAISKSKWFDIINEEGPEFEAYVRGMKTYGGEDCPANGLEALYYAMDTDWRASGERSRRLIFFFSNGEPVPLGRYKGHPNYPTDMVEDMDGLVNTWMGICPAFMDEDRFMLDQRRKRMILFAPAGTVYETIPENLNLSYLEDVGDDFDENSIDMTPSYKLILTRLSGFGF